jgi:arginase
MEWLVVDVPLDSSGSGRGEERAPQALRAAGLLAAVDGGNGGIVDAAIRDAVRDPVTGVVGADEIRRATRNTAAAVRDMRAEPDLPRPLLVGGDCTLLVGVFGALPPGTALWFLDGHPDFLDGTTSETGEAADMDLSILTGHGPAGIVDGPAGGGPLVDPALVDLVGHRRPDDDLARVEHRRLAAAAVRSLTARQVRDRGPADVGTAIAGQGDGPAWLHLDLDVLDAEALPAVTYPQPDGLSWDDLVALTRPLVRSGRVCGISVADFNPDLDPDGAHARRVVDALAEILAP